MGGCQLGGLGGGVLGWGGAPMVSGGCLGVGVIPATVGDVSLVTTTISVVRPWGPQSVKALAGWRIATLS